MIRDVVEISASTFPKNIAVTTSVARDLWPALADATQMHQAVLNLCLNARDALSAGGRIEISVRNVEVDETFARQNQDMVPGHFVLIEVLDTGTGIEAEVLDRIFEPFFTTKPLGKGSGLGLSNVLGIVRSHGGCVSVSSKVGKGSTFKVYVPAAPGTESPPTSESDHLPRGRGELILLVDDELAILDITSKALRAFGYKVLVAEDGTRALGLFAVHHQEIALVLTDMMMPGMDGAALIATLLKMDPRVRVIAASGQNTTANADAAVRAGARSFLAKPYSAETMLKAISNRLHGTSSRAPFKVD